MDVHNLMEEIVKKKVDALYENAKKSKPEWLSCDCQNCRLDTVNYVLNRIPPKYIVSGRGAVHVSMDLENTQIKADVETLAIEGMKAVNSAKRPYHLKAACEESSDEKNSEPHFNFCAVSGKVLDGANFEPVLNATVVLKFEGEEAQMFDDTWQNPYITMESTKGTFSFLIKSVPAEKSNEKKTFNFFIEVSAPGYESLKYYFELPIVSEEEKRNHFDPTFSFRLNDCVIFKK